MPQSVCERTGGEHRGGERDDVGVHQPLALCQTTPEIRAYGGQRDGDDGGVQLHQTEGQRQRDQGGEHPSGGDGLIGRWCGVGS